MALNVFTDDYALYNGCCIETMQSLPADSVHLSIYSPPFAGLYHYSSDDRDLSNNHDYKSFFDHYGFAIDELTRLTMPGRITAVHCMDVPNSNTGCDSLTDFPGDIIRMHQGKGWDWTARYAVWKEPLGVRNRTMQKNLAHKTVVDDATKCATASADYLLVFRKKGGNPEPVGNPNGLSTYAGSRQMPADLLQYRHWKGKQTENRFSHWIWRQYASAFWDDVRIDRVLPYRQVREEQDEKHVHPLQLDVIERCIQLWSNVGDTVLTPFMGVGSEAYVAAQMSRKAIGIELKESYYSQAVKNLAEAVRDDRVTDDQQSLSLD